MKINHKNQLCNDTVCASIRMTRSEYLALREFMHTEVGHDVYFPYGTTIVKHGYGWYYMSPTNGKRGVQKMEYALKVLRWFRKWHEEQIDAELKRLMPTILDVNLSVAAFSQDTNAFTYISSQVPVDSSPHEASQQQLQMLAARFSKERHV